METEILNYQTDERDIASLTEFHLSNQSLVNSSFNHSREKYDTVFENIKLEKNEESIENIKTEEIPADDLTEDSNLLNFR